MKPLGRETDLEKTVFNVLRHTTMPFWVAIGALAAVFLAGVIALIRQWFLGLGVTGMSRPIYWGIYITNFVFFIGISHAGTLISAILRVTQAEWRRPITRVAEAITFFALILGALQILIDLGRLDRVFNLLIYGRFQSPLLWDVTCISIYLLSSTLYLYLPMIPDLARLRDRGLGIRSRGPDGEQQLAVGSRWAWLKDWRYHLYRVLSLGWHGSREQVRRLERAISIMAVLIIPIAVSVHTVVSWIFGMNMQPMWHSTILGPYFVVGAIFSGIAMLFCFMTLIRKIWHLEPWIGAKQYDYLGLLLLTMTLFWGYFTLAEYLTTGYGTLVHEQEVLRAKLSAEYAPWFYAMLVCNFVIPIAILVRRKGRTPLGTLIASLAILVGMWIERFTIIVPTLTRPSLGYEKAIYAPTFTEVLITAASLSLFALLFLLFFKLFPAISVWEVEEGEHIAAVKRKAEELLHAPQPQV
ncbi:MAG: NrfD/PsrC family molybdoenzyme membrane anchor subunit [Anaerolineae bacterium]